MRSPLTKAASLAAFGLLCLSGAKAAPSNSDLFIIEPTGDPVVTYNSEEIFLDGGYIVEFDNSKKAKVPDFYAALDNAGVQATRRYDFNHPLFSGSSFTVNATADPHKVIDAVRSVVSVQDAWPLRLISRQSGNVLAKKGGASAKKGAPKIAKRKAEGDEWSTHVMTGVNKLHAEGHTGKDTLIAILDTGVDYKHPDLGGGFGDKYKVSKGYDFVGDNGVSDPTPDSDPYDDCGLHGTYTAGIIGANAGELNFKGVAPDAKLGAYRIFDCQLYTSEDIIISAYLKAYDDKADVIVTSLGGYTGTNDDPTSRVVSRIAETGVVCVATAGELGGPPFQAYSPATAQGVISVASVENSVRPIYRLLGQYKVGEADQKTFEYEPTDVHFPAGTKSVWTWDYEFDFDPLGPNCPKLPEEIPDINEQVVMVPLCIQTLLDAAFRGVKYLMVHDGGSILQSVSTRDEQDIIAGLGIVDRKQGDEWKGSVVKGEKVELVFASVEEEEWKYREEPNDATGGSINLFSAWGPNMQMDPVPIVAAPGGHVLSTLPVKDGSYGVLSGAGAAGPYAAGVAALLKQAKGKDFDPKSLSAVLEGTSKPLKYNDGKSTADFVAPAIQQGGGLINAHLAVHSQTQVSPSHLTFKEKAKATFKISNTGDKEMWYSLSHEGSHTAYTVFSKFQDHPSVPEMDSASSKVTISPDRVLVPPNSNAEVEIELTPPGLAAERVPVYSGYIVVKPDEGDETSVSYSGTASDLKSIEPFNKAATFLTSSVNFGEQIDDGFLFELPTDIDDPDAEGPEVNLPVALISLDFYTSEIIAELVPGEPIEGFNGRLGTEDPFGPFPPGAALFIPVWGNLADGTRLPAGNFSLSLSALKFTGEAGDDGSWHKVTTNAFSVAFLEA